MPTYEELTPEIKVIAMKNAKALSFQSYAWAYVTSSSMILQKAIIDILVTLNPDSKLSDYGYLLNTAELTEQGEIILIDSPRSIEVIAKLLNTYAEEGLTVAQVIKLARGKITDLVLADWLTVYDQVDEMESFIRDESIEFNQEGVITKHSDCFDLNTTREVRLHLTQSREVIFPVTANTYLIDTIAPFALVFSQYNEEGKIPDLKQLLVDIRAVKKANFNYHGDASKINGSADFCLGQLIECIAKSKNIHTTLKNTEFSMLKRQTCSSASLIQFAVELYEYNNVRSRHDLKQNQILWLTQWMCI